MDDIGYFVSFLRSFRLRDSREHPSSSDPLLPFPHPSHMAQPQSVTSSQFFSKSPFLFFLSIPSTSLLHCFCCPLKHSDLF
mmetsp:Transcript_21584/g.59984  ORF Transcript_21584/g.59984 Transcript_21584/m.59984 type:complete len:81 (+) Transcript_21584:183-425(+)